MIPCFRPDFEQDDKRHPAGHVRQPPGHRPLPSSGSLPLHPGMITLQDVCFNTRI